MQILCQLKFGSNLYGTNTPKSDLDLRTIFWPNAVDTLLGKPNKSFKNKMNADGSVAGPNAVMDEGCVEEEFIPVNEFFRNVANGECKAVETFFAILGGNVQFVDTRFKELCLEFFDTFKFNIPHNGMVGFAKKSTLDYVHRANRLKNIQQIVDFFNSLGLDFQSKIRLDSQFGSGTVFSAFRDEVLKNLVEYDQVSFTTCQISNANDSKQVDALEIAGRTFMVTTPMKFVMEVLNGLIKDYGHRVKKIENNSIVEWKSIAHAVRSYEQAIELCSTGSVTFPRSNTEFLLKIVKGELPAVEVLEHLAECDAKLDSFSEKQPIELQDFAPYVEFMLYFARRDIDARLLSMIDYTNLNLS